MFKKKLKKMLQNVFNRNADRPAAGQRESVTPPVPQPRPSTNTDTSTATATAPATVYFHYYGDFKNLYDYSHGAAIPVDVGSIESVAEKPVSFDTHEESCTLIYRKNTPPLPVQETPETVRAAISAYTGSRNSRPCKRRHCNGPM